jgi:glycine cleavage system regulatory protein
MDSKVHFSRTFALTAAAQPPSEITTGHGGSVKQSVLTVVGPSGSHALNDVATTVIKLKGNLETTRFSKLGQQYALVALVTMPVQLPPEKLEEDILELLPEHTVTITPTEPQRAEGGAKTIMVELEGVHQPEVAPHLTAVLDKFNTRIRDFQIDTVSAPFTDYTFLHIKGVIDVPYTVFPADFREALDELEKSLSVQITLHDTAQTLTDSDEEFSGSDSDVEELLFDDDFEFPEQLNLDPQLPGPKTN